MTKSKAIQAAQDKANELDRPYTAFIENGEWHVVPFSDVARTTLLGVKKPEQVVCSPTKSRREETLVVDNCRLEIDFNRGVVYVHDSESRTRLRICRLKGLRPSDGLLDITHKVGFSQD